MNIRMMTIFLSVGWLIGLAGCSDSGNDGTLANPGFGIAAGETDSESGAGEGDPVVSRLTIEPREPVSRSRVRAVVDIDGGWKSMEYVWDLNGEVFGTNSAEVVLPVISTGDKISVRVTPTSNQGVVSESRTASLAVRNQAPLLTGLAIELVPEGAEWSGEGELWKAAVGVEDPDGDDVDIEYRWFVDGVLSDVEEEYFPVARLTRGNKLEVQVRAHDGRTWSNRAHSGEVEVGNSPPTIVSTPPRPDERGRFRYPLEVEDADGDHNFRFALGKAPDGMEIDSVEGIVSWVPTLSQTGRHDIEVIVTDVGGAEAKQEFSISLTERVETDESYPASPR